MAEFVPVLIGTAGLAASEVFVLHDGADIVIGRSRSCDISLRRMAAYLKSPAEQRDADHDFNTVSRRHLRLQVHGNVVRLQDLSTNGTFCNEQPLEQSRECDLGTGTFTLRLGTRETFQMLMLPKDDPRLAAKPNAAVPAGESETNGKTDD
jgi:pSer/pThr/pTyr-binding forkhead associated (FHA) protein